MLSIDRIISLAERDVFGDSQFELLTYIRSKNLSLYDQHMLDHAMTEISIIRRHLTLMRDVDELPDCLKTRAMRMKTHMEDLIGPESF